MIDVAPELSPMLRPAVFCLLLVVISMLERLAPMRLSDPLRLVRWPANFGLVAIGTAILIALQLSLVVAALWAEARGFGLFNRVAAPAWLEFLLAWLLLDLAIYLQHRAFHEISWLWPLHRVHHSDVEFDVTTGLRFHPGELLLSQLFKIALILLLGAPWAAVIAFEIGLSSFALLTHANLKLSPRLEPVLRSVVVTPDMHRIHHSAERDEHDSNYGNLLSLWDRLLGSYRRAARQPQREMRIGLHGHRHPEQQSLIALLLQPRER